MRGFSALQRTDRQAQADSDKLKCIETKERILENAKQIFESSLGKETRSRAMTNIIDDRSTTKAHSSYIKSTIEVPPPTNLSTSVKNPGQSSCSGQKESSAVNNGVPWHVAMVHEKEKCVLMLEDKVKRLSQFEAESKEKDYIIAVLQDEVTELTQRLNKAIDHTTIKIQAQSILDMQSEINRLKQFETDSKVKDSIIINLRDEIWQLGLQVSHLRFNSAVTISNTTLDDTFSHVQGKQEWKAGDELSVIPMEKTSEEEFTEERKEERNEVGDTTVKIVINTREEDEDEIRYKEMFELGPRPGPAEYIDHSEANDLDLEDENPVELTKLIIQNEELKKKLNKTRKSYNMSTGAVMSVNRERSLAEAQLRNAQAEVERLQKELKDRCTQLQDMSNKFSNLREENNRIKVMADLQKENFNFQELVAKLQSGLTEKNEEIVRLKAEIDKLQLHITVEEVRKKQLQTQCDDAITQGNLLQRELQELQIALKFTGTRFERFISKIVQALYTTPGIVQPTTQISDEDTLEMFQKILDDRLEFHRMLTDNGIPVPPLFVNENPNAS